MRTRHYSSNLMTLQTQLPRSAPLRVDSFLPPCLFVTSLNSEQLFPRGNLIFPRESEQILSFFTKGKWKGINHHERSYDLCDSRSSGRS